jgi:hypothetical protein
MKTLTHSQLVEKLKQLNGTAIVGLLTLTEADIYKTGNPHKVILKQVRSVGITGASYEGAVNRQAERVGISNPNFESSGLPDYEEWIVKGKIIRHKTKGTLYLRTQTTPGQRGQRSSARVLNYRTADGKFISYSEIAQFLKGPSESKKQSKIGLESRSGMTDDAPAQVWVRKYKFESIQKIRIQGETFAVTRD